MGRAAAALAPVLALALALAGTAAVTATGPAPADPPVCSGTENTHPVYTDAPTLVSTVPNGKLMVTGSETLSPRLRVVHVYGTAYEMGFAHGTLLKAEATELYSSMLEWVYGTVDKYIHFLPQWLRELIEKDGVEAALEFTYWMTKPYIPQRFTDEISGVANATGLDFDYVMRINLFPSLIQASCSELGAWGDAIADGGSLYQLRALDWGTTSPMANFPVVLVYHPADGDGHAFATLSWAGWIGALTGYSSADVGVSEKVWDKYTGKKTYSGMPWSFVLRDILQYDQTVAEGLARLESTNRTCSIFVGLGDVAPGGPHYNVIEYSLDEVTSYNDTNFTQPHTNFKDVVYVDKHTQPSTHPCLPSLIKEYYGQIDAETVFRQLTARFQTGDLHIAVFDFERRLMYAANASPPSANGTAGTPAYDMPFTQIDLAALFSEEQ